MKQWYEDKTFTAAAREVIGTAEQICSTYSRQGYRLTLRQLYYRFIAGDLLPESRRDKELGTKNTEKNYKWLGALISDARLAGLIDWAHLEDRTREPGGGDYGWADPDHRVGLIASGYQIPKWPGQDQYVEVWVEKEALADVIARPAGRWNVTTFSCRGYVSQSAMYEAGQRLTEQEDRGRQVTVIHLGDHDPSGLDMTEDIRKRLRLFGSGAVVDRIALNMDQVIALNPPPSPAKVTDSRYQKYVDQYGADCWELDAIEPAQLDALVDEAITSRLDRDLWDSRVAQEQRDLQLLEALAGHWGEVENYLRRMDYVSDGTGDDA